MNIIHGGYSTKKPAESGFIRPEGSGGKTGARKLSGTGPSPKSFFVSTEYGSGLPKIRWFHPTRRVGQEIISLQRAISKTQLILGGLQGFTSLFDLESLTATDYISRITYEGETVLSAYTEKLSDILSAKDPDSLNVLIREVKKELAQMASKLGEYQVAEQNKRSVLGKEEAPDLEDTLKSIIGALKKAGDLPIRLKRENVLNLLG